jgi:3-oxoacyl-[acyl-carrier protein] reductase
MMSLPSESRFSDRLAFVTGADGAIGSAVVAALRATGARVVAADASGTIAPSDASPSPGETVRLDVRDAAAIRSLVDTITATIGPIDTLVNVAGVTSFGSAETLAEAEWDRVIDINLKGTFLCCQAVIPVMKSAGFGRIVNLGSVVGKNSGNARPWLDPSEQERAGNVAYGVSKIGVHAMTGFLARELAAHGITVNAVAPGPIATRMTATFPDSLKALIPVGRMGTVEDVVHAVLFLADRASSFITGEVLDLNGGMLSD